MDDLKTLEILEKIKIESLDYNEKCAISKTLDWRAQAVYYQSQVQSLDPAILGKHRVDAQDLIPPFDLVRSLGQLE